MTVDEVVDSVIYISENPEPLPSGPDWLPDSLKFVCSDSTGTYLVAMNATNAGALSLDKKNFIDVIPEGFMVIPYCWARGHLHLSSLRPLHFYQFDSLSPLGSTDYYFLKDNTTIGATIGTADDCRYLDWDHFYGYTGRVNSCYQDQTTFI